MKRWMVCLGVVALGTCWLDEPNARAGKEPALRVATFCCDVTPPVDARFRGGWGQPLTRLVDPLLAKGILLDDGRSRYVLCAVDWCELCNGSHMLWRRKIAEAAGTDVSRVVVQSVHQHTAPIADGDAQAILDRQPSPPKCSDVRSIDEIGGRLAAAVKQAQARLEPFDRVGTGQAKVDRVAANRRVKLADGKIHVRWSSCSDPDLQKAPEGLVDPVLKTVTLAHGDKPLVRLHYYATHPQTGLGDGPISADFVGFARERFQAKERVFQVYFTGCAGNVTAGKYNDGSGEARAGLTQRLLAAMETSAASTRLAPAERIGWQTLPVVLPARSDPGFGRAENERIAADPKLDPMARVVGACRVAFQQRSGNPIDLAMLEIGPVRVLHLPGEPFIEFQLLAERLAPKSFVAVAGYADGAPGYLCTERSYQEGGYEPVASMLTPGAETVLNQAIAQLLRRK